MEQAISGLSSLLLCSKRPLEGSQESHDCSVLANLPGLQWVKANDDPYWVQEQKHGGQKNIILELIIIPSQFATN